VSRGSRGQLTDGSRGGSGVKKCDHCHLCCVARAACTDAAHCYRCRWSVVCVFDNNFSVQKRLNRLQAGLGSHMAAGNICYMGYRLPREGALLRGGMPLCKARGLLRRRPFGCIDLDVRRSEIGVGAGERRGWVCISRRLLR